MAKEQKEKINPFDAGVNYADFMEALGKSTVKEYCKDLLTDEQIEWLEKDLEIYKQSNK